jgi:hypothetical protein
MEQTATGGAGKPASLQPQDMTQVCSAQGCGSVLMELLWRIPPLTASQPEDILLLCCRFDDIYNLGLAKDQEFIIRVLPLVAGDLFTFLGECLQRRDKREQCKAHLRERFFQDLCARD